MAIPITQSKTVYRAGDLIKPTFIADRLVSWTASSGVISPQSSTNSTLTPLNRTQIITVTGSSGSDQGIKTIQVFATFPLQPNYGYEVELDDKTISSIAEDGSTVFRVKGEPKRTWQLQMPDRAIGEYQTLIAFWIFHRKYIEFYYEDLALNELRLVRFDSGIKITPAGPDQISMNCLVREV